MSTPMATEALREEMTGSVPSSPTFLPMAYVQNQFLPFNDAHVSIATHALHYGTAVLGGIRGMMTSDSPRHARLFRLDDHCQRLSNSAKYLNYSIGADVLKAKVIEFVQANQPQESFYVRPLIYTSSLGIAPRLHNVEKDLLMYGLPMGNYFSTLGVRCRISSWYRQEDRSQPLRGKSSAAYIASALAKTEAVASGFDEAILMNSQGKVSEASAMNLFVVRNGRLITPSVDQDILEGITRDSVLTLARNSGIPVIERPVDKTELMIADEIFLCGTAAQITPILSVENYTLPGDRPITTRLREQLQAIALGQDSTYGHWITSIQLPSLPD